MCRRGGSDGSLDRLSSGRWTDYEHWYGEVLGDADSGQAFRLAGAYWSGVGGADDLLVVPIGRDSTSLGDCDLYGNTTAGVCASGDALRNETAATGNKGLNAMEVYLR